MIKGTVRELFVVREPLARAVSIYYFWGELYKLHAARTSRLHTDPQSDTSRRSDKINRQQIRLGQTGSNNGVIKKNAAIHGSFEYHGDETTVPPANIAMAFVIRFANGLFAGNISTLQGAMADITPPDRRASRMGIMGAAFSAGFTTGPAIGGLLAQPSRGALGFQLPLLVAAGFAAASALAVLVLVRESRPEPIAGRQQRPRLEGLKDAFAHVVIGRILLISGIVVVGFAGIEATYGLWTQARFGWGPKEIGLAFMGIGLLGAFCQGYLSGRLVRRFGEARTLTGGLMLMGLGIATQGLSPVWEVAILGFALVCIGQSICFPNLTAMISQAAPPDRQGEMLGLNMSGMALARIGGPVLAGWLFSSIAPGAPFAFAAALILPGLWFAGEVRKRSHLIA